MFFLEILWSGDFPCETFSDIMGYNEEPIQQELIELYIHWDTWGIEGASVHKARAEMRVKKGM
jgi:hypothetical protein